MNAFQSLFWKTRNLYNVYYKQAHVRGLGLLPHRKKDTDFGLDYKKLGWGFHPPKPTKEKVDNSNDWVFNQKDLNICVFASNTLASSYQEGKRFSVRFAVQMAKKLGMITGNGFSYIRAGLDISQKYGRLPYEMMPDEVTNWTDYSHYDITDEMLEEAAKWKTPAYRKVSTAEEAVALLEQGFVLVTALTWYQAMNSPENYNGFLMSKGSVIGGHAIDIPGDNAPDLVFTNYLNKQTFGTQYGDQGMVKIKDIFASGFYEVYVMDKIEGRSDAERIAGRFDGKLLKAEGPENPGIYKIKDGSRHVLLESQWNDLGNPKPVIVSQETLSLIPDGDVYVPDGT